MPDLSLILPCYRAAPLARRSADRLSAYLGRRPLTWELIVVDDGGGDFPHSAFDDLPEVRLIPLPANLGKGGAVRAGMLAASGDVRIFTDVDLPYDLDLIPTMASIIRDRGFHMVIGDRSLPSSRYLTEISFPRKLTSALFTGFVGTMVTGGFFDTQCGLKAVRADVAEELFRLQRLDRFAFDVELVYLALKHKLDVHRIPVQLRNNETSSVRLWRDAARGFVDVFRIKANQLRGLYASDRLEEIRQREFEAIRARAERGEAPDAARSAADQRRHAVT